MAEGFAGKCGWQAFSAGIKPEIRVNPFAVKVMAEGGIDISHHVPKSVVKYLSDDFYLAATVCERARESCPNFIGKCNYQIHQGFEDPADAKGNHDEIMKVYRQIRDKIRTWIEKLNKDYLF